MLRLVSLSGFRLPWKWKICILLVRVRYIAYKFRDEIHSRLRLLDFTLKLKSNFYIRISIFLLFRLNN